MAVDSDIVTLTKELKASFIEGKNLIKLHQFILLKIYGGCSSAG